MSFEGYFERREREYNENIAEILEAFEEDPRRKLHMDRLADAFFENLERNERCEYGGWGLDDKRPFGNSSVESDIAEIIGIEYDPNEDEREEFHAYLNELYDDLGHYLKYMWKNK